MVDAGKDDWFADLKRNVQEMKKALTKEQLEGIRGMRIKVGQFPGVVFDEPIYDVKMDYLNTVTSEYLDSKENLKRNQNVLDDKQGFENYKRKFEESISKPCNTFDDIMDPSLADYHMNGWFGLIVFEDVKKGDKDELEMLFDAGFCHSVMREIRKSICESYKHLVGRE